MRCMEKPWLQPRTTLPVQFKQGQHVGQPGAVLEGWGGDTPQSSGSRQIIVSQSAKHELDRKGKSIILE
jgi:hypothetical protein